MAPGHCSQCCSHGDAFEIKIGSCHSLIRNPPGIPCVPKVMSRLTTVVAVPPAHALPSSPVSGSIPGQHFQPPRLGHCFLPQKHSCPQNSPYFCNSSSLAGLSANIAPAEIFPDQPAHHPLQIQVSLRYHFRYLVIPPHSTVAPVFYCCWVFLLLGTVKFCEGRSCHCVTQTSHSPQLPGGAW